MSNERKGAVARSNDGADRNSCTLSGNSFQQGVSGPPTSGAAA